jgi:hypothetical protein
VVGVTEPFSLLTRERGWVYYDDLGYRRAPDGNIIDSPESQNLVHAWSPLESLPRLHQAKPIMAFSAQFDTRVSSSQTIRFINAIEDRFGAGAPVYMIEHENVGHNGRAEALDEAMFVANQLGLTSLNPILP